VGVKTATKVQYMFSRGPILVVFNLYFQRLFSTTILSIFFGVTVTIGVNRCKSACCRVSLKASIYVSLTFFAGVHRLTPFRRGALRSRGSHVRIAPGTPFFITIWFPMFFIWKAWPNLFSRGVPPLKQIPDNRLSTSIPSNLKNTQLKVTAFSLSYSVELTGFVIEY
jgi:hypothetical protein